MARSQYSAEPVEELVLSSVWDAAVRVVHWLIVALVGSSWVTGERGWLGWHKASGYATLALVLFRIYWGFYGGSTARFASFLHGVRTVGRYVSTLGVRNGRYGQVGHNPLGGWNVLALLGLLFLQTGLGLFSVDVDGLESGPLAAHVSFATGRRLAALHQGTFNVLLTLIGLHIAAVVFHWIYHRENLVAPMLTGLKWIPRSQADAVRLGAPWRALLGLAVCIGIVAMLVSTIFF